MEYKFKTFYEGSLRDCYVDLEGRIIVKNKLEEGEKIIGSIYAGGNFAQREVYQSTGKSAKNGAIYRGHIIESPLFQLGWKATVFWDPLKAGFYLDFSKIGCKEKYQFDDNSLKSEDFRIVGHVELEGK